MSSFKQIVIIEPPVTRQPDQERTEVTVDALAKIAYELLHDGAPYAEHAATNEVESDHETGQA
jgi:hypothetical protein